MLDELWIKMSKAVYTADERTVNSISGLLATHPGTAKHLILVLMYGNLGANATRAHLCRRPLCIVAQQKSPSASFQATRLLRQ